MIEIKRYILSFSGFFTRNNSYTRMSETKKIIPKQKQNNPLQNKNKTSSPCDTLKIQNVLCGDFSSLLTTTTTDTEITIVNSPHARTHLGTLMVCGFARNYAGGLALLGNGLRAAVRAEA
uniref:(northern house mosquito) hypothetical protein n=1 Tax=Culex pipiens TaxID=7175 RepID=A0A8D8E6J0_CULPI